MSASSVDSSWIDSYKSVLAAAGYDTEIDDGILVVTANGDTIAMATRMPGYVEVVPFEPSDRAFRVRRIIESIDANQRSKRKTS